MVLVAVSSLPTPVQDTLPTFRMAWRDAGKSTPGAPELISEVLVAPDNGVIAIGSTSTKKGSSYVLDILVRKHDPSGKLLWEKQIDPLGKGGQDTVQGAVMDTAGNVYIAISTPVGNFDGFTLMRMSSADGNVAWTKTADTGNDRATAFGIAIDKSGNPVQVGGYGSNARAEIFAVKWSPDGKPVWTQRWKAPTGKVNVAKAVAVGPNGDVYAAGYSESAEGGEDAVALRFDAASGTVKWTQHVRGAGLARDAANAIAVDDAGNAYITGNIYMQGSNNSVFAARLDGTTGAVKWQLPLLEPRGATGDGVGIHVDANGITMGAHMYLVSGNGQDFTVSRISLDGKELWRASANSGDGLSDEATDFMVDRYGNAYVTGGSSKRNGMPNPFVIRVNPDGKVAWQYLEAPASPAQLRPGSLVIDNETGTVFVGSGSIASTETDWNLIAIEQSPEAQDFSGQVQLGKTLEFQPSPQTTPSFVRQSRFAKGVVWTATSPTKGKFDSATAQFTAPSDVPGTIPFTFTLDRKGLKTSTATVRVNVVKPPRRG